MSGPGILLADGGALSGLAVLAVGGMFIVLGVVVLAILGGSRSFSAQRRRRAAIEPMADRLQRLDTALLHADEAVRTADQEHLFARAEFGDERASELGGAVQQARRALDLAFSRRREVEDLLEQGREVQARALADRIGAELEPVLGDLRERTGQIGALRDDARHAPERLRRATERLAQVEERLPAAREALGSVGRGTEGIDRAGALLARARQELQEAGGPADGDRSHEVALASEVGAPGREGDEELAHLAAAEHALQDADALVTASIELPERIQRARAELPGELARLDDSLARARATRDADPRLPQAIAVGEQARRAPEDQDPVARIARVRAAITELDAAIEAARTRYDRAQEAAASSRRGPGGGLSDAYDPRIGDAAAAAGRRRYGPLGVEDVLDPSVPRGIAGEADAPIRSGTEMLGLALGELTRRPPGMPGHHRRRRF